MHYQSGIFALLPLAVAALPQAPAKGEKSAHYKARMAQYNMTAHTCIFANVNSVQDIADLECIGPYEGLDYSGIGSVAAGVGGAGNGVIPQSMPNVGAYSSALSSTSGDPEIRAQSPGDFFNFSQFYFGCVANSIAGPASLPTECTVTVTGYNNEAVVAAQSFRFVPGTFSLREPMVQANLENKFQDVEIVRFYTDAPAGDAAGVVTFLDQMEYTTYCRKNVDSSAGEEESSSSASAPASASASAFASFSASAVPSAFAAGSPQGGNGKPQGGHGKPQGGHGKPQGGHEKPQGDHGKPQGDHGKPQGGHGKPQGAHEKPQGAQEKPQGAQERPQGAQEKPQGAQEKPQGGHGKPQGAQAKPQGADQKKGPADEEESPCEEEEEEAAQGKPEGAQGKPAWAGHGKPPWAGRGKPYWVTPMGDDWQE
ncbi:hypothetical protein LTR37_012357 [Vermiconidia calcicola]|uniref:Uncharacterized protein n=1 Tax=Vermiconidia calcicola TaxID=1690605 RepID=A0ACC3N0L3_9PEZI|nr:hypothetical protein LTR37_012357 [Vermiconidia calcicola]